MKERFKLKNHFNLSHRGTKANGRLTIKSAKTDFVNTLTDIFAAGGRTVYYITKFWDYNLSSNLISVLIAQAFRPYSVPINLVNPFCYLQLALWPPIHYVPSCNLFFPSDRFASEHDENMKNFLENILQTVCELLYVRDTLADELVKTHSIIITQVSNWKISYKRQMRKKYEITK